MSRRRSGSDTIMSVLAKAVAQIIVLLVIFAIRACVEFNMTNNYTVEVTDKVMSVGGVNCNGDVRSWQFKIVATRYGYKSKNYADLEVWESGSDVITKVTIQGENQLSFEGCDGQQVDIATIWEVDSDKLHMTLRVHPGFEVYPASQ